MNSLEKFLSINIKKWLGEGSPPPNGIISKNGMMRIWKYNGTRVSRYLSEPCCFAKYVSYLMSTQSSIKISRLNIIYLVCTYVAKYNYVIVSS